MYIKFISISIPQFDFDSTVELSTKWVWVTLGKERKQKNQLHSFGVLLFMWLWPSWTDIAYIKLRITTRSMFIIILINCIVCVHYVGDNDGTDIETTVVNHDHCLWTYIVTNLPFSLFCISLTYTLISCFHQLKSVY